jgi:hypothetical protein
MGTAPTMSITANNTAKHEITWWESNMVTNEGQNAAEDKREVK